MNICFFFRKKPAGAQSAQNRIRQFRRLTIFLLFLAVLILPSVARAAGSDRRDFNILLIFSEQTPSEIRTDMSGAFFDALAARNEDLRLESQLSRLAAGG